MPQVIVLPGLGSPECDAYRSVYQVLQKGAEVRGHSFECLVYREQGHLAEGEIRGEITLQGVAHIVDPVLRHAERESLLLCRSFGCLLPGYLASEHGLVFGAFRRIALWGAVPLFEMWRLYGTDERLTSRKEIAASKGARLSSQLYSSLTPLEVCCEALLEPEIIIGVGTKDPFTSVEFAQFLATRIRRFGNNHVYVRTVDGAPHEVGTNCPSPIIEGYLRALLD